KIGTREIPVSASYDVGGSGLAALLENMESARKRLMDDPLEILLIEDDADTRANMCDILSLDGHRVITAGSARQARTLLKENAVSVILLDRKLPDGTAEELLPEFRHQHPESDIIVVTGFADLDGTIAALRYGAADYILKPVNADALRASLQRILDRRRILRALHREHQFAERILQTAEAVVLVLDLNGRVLHVNPHLSRIAGWTADEIAGSDWFESCVPDEGRAALRDVCERAAAGNETRGIIGRILTKKGRTRQIRWSHTALKDEQGAVNSVLAVGVDVTDLVGAQERALQSERLVAIGQTMTALAHESRNALQRIQASVDFLGLELEDNPNAERDLRSIERAADDLRGLLEEVRSYAAPINLDRTWCDLGGVWQSAWQLLAQSRSGRDAKLFEHIGDVDLTLHIDAVRLEQVFRNLFENSLAACEDPVRISVHCSETADQRGVEVTIHDNGPGLSVDQREKVFVPFFTTKSTGTGLGMAIVQRIVEAHGGTICIGKAATGGACFVINLPRT
ncbi:MAG: response regulator, partial [Burkholderiaceae bacterium]|nr:response regulator [Burkholderiaceae bacterium]